MDFLDIQNGVALDMLRTTEGCTEGCAHCGAYPNGYGAEDLRIRRAPLEHVKELLQANVEDTQRQLASWLSTNLTTDVNTEPLAHPDFAKTVELIHHISGGNSRMIAISHGVRTGVGAMYARLTKVIHQMQTNVIKHFVLTMDYQRLKGTIDDKLNETSYLDTLTLLKGGFGPDKRITVSLQGTSHNSAVSFKRVETMYERIRAKLGWSDQELSQLNEDRRVSYVSVGRAAEEISEDDSISCDVVPDKDYLVTRDPAPLYRARLDCFRNVVEVQPHRPGKTYNDTVDKGKWQPGLVYKEGVWRRATEEKSKLRVLL